MPVVTRAQKRKREPQPTKFQDLPLELLKEIARHLGVKDVLKLMIVNKRLYSSYAMDQSIVFGKHVAVVALGHTFAGIKKFVDSPSFQLNPTLLPFVKRIDSCDQLLIPFYAEPTGSLLKQLKSVNHLDFNVDSEEYCLNFLNNFRGSVKNSAELSISIGPIEQDQAMKERLGKFIESQLNGCEKVTLTPGLRLFEGCFYVYHEAMMKTQLKMIQIEAPPAPEFEQILYLIVNQGIPSKNSEAWIHIEEEGDDGDDGDDETDAIRARVGDCLSQAQGLQRVDDAENHFALVSRANELLRETYEDADWMFNKDADWVFDQNTSCFRRRIDPVTSCIYVFRSDPQLLFLAFYMPSQCSNL